MNRNNKKTILTILSIIGFIIIVAYSYFFLNSASYFSKSNNLVEQNVDESLSQYSRATNIIPENPKNRNTVVPVSTVIGCSLEVITSKINPTSSTTVYSIEVKNVGIQICQNTSISTYYASDEKFISAIPKPTASNYYWVLGQLESGKLVSITFTTNKKSLNMEQTESCITADNARQDVCTVFKEGIVPSINPEPKLQIVEIPPAKPVVLDKKENGTWVWKSPMDMNQEYRDFILSTAQQNNFNAIYVTIDDYLDIAFLSDGLLKNEQKNRYMDALELLVKQANQKGISIDAEAGWKDWAELENTYKPFAIVDFVKEYNATRVYKLRALQYDVEPYLMSTYEKNKTALLKNFVSLIDQTVNKLEGSNIAFAIVIPHFYDETQKWTPSFLYNKKNTFTFNHLLTILERRPDSSIILMSYRNFANGKNSTIEISKAEIEKVTNEGYKTRIIVAQETGNVDPDYVTFFSTDKNYFTEQTNVVKEVFLPYKNFGGMATHYMETFVELER